ncbi:MAG: peroxiredoxin [Polyangiaceae bacterium]|nr:peroxiredoxin [Polyangiaceae bacterium]
MTLVCGTLALSACGSEPTAPAGATSARSGASVRPTATATATSAASASDAPTPLAAGDAAPDVTLALHDGSKVALSSLRGKRVLVYFYPKDDTPGCRVEAQGLRDKWPDVQAAGLVVYGVSTQDAASHQAFIDKETLPFPLVVDVDGAIARAFHVPVKNGFAARQSFLVGADGKLEKVWLEVAPPEHAAQVLAAIKGG